MKAAMWTRATRNQDLNTQQGEAHECLGSANKQDEIDRRMDSLRVARLRVHPGRNHEVQQRRGSAKVLRLGLSGVVLLRDRPDRNRIRRGALVEADCLLR